DVFDRTTVEANTGKIVCTTARFDRDCTAGEPHVRDISAVSGNTEIVDLPIGLTQPNRHHIRSGARQDTAHARFIDPSVQRLSNLNIRDVATRDQTAKDRPLYLQAGDRSRFQRETASVEKYFVARGQECSHRSADIRFYLPAEALAHRKS